MTTNNCPTPHGLVAHDEDDRDNVYARETPMHVSGPEAGWGFHRRAETLNGRLAMLGFVAAIATELLTGEGFLQLIGL